MAISAALGLVTGLLAAILSFILYRIEDGFHRLPIHWMWWPAIGAIVVGIGGLFDVRVLGAGYDVIQALVDGNLVVKAVLLLLVVKAIVWLVALGSGTSGGILAPLLIIGGCTGFLIGQYLPGDPGFWAMIGMAGNHERCHARADDRRAVRRRADQPFVGHLPETIAAGVGGLCHQRPHHEALDPDREDRAARQHMLREYSIDALEFLQASQLMTADPATLAGDMTSTDAVRFFETEAEHRSYPVVDGRGRLLGLSRVRTPCAGKSTKRRKARSPNRCRTPRRNIAYPKRRQQGRRHDGRSRAWAGSPSSTTIRAASSESSRVRTC